MLLYRLRKLAANCEFADLSRELKSAIIQNCQSKQTKARSPEISETQAAGIETVNAIQHNTRNYG